METQRREKGAEKTGYVQAMFDAIVPKYDLMNRLMTGGRDQSWRRRAAQQARVAPGGRILDVAAGTADLSLALARRFPSATVIAMDFSLPMLYAGQAKTGAQPEGKRIAFSAADALRLPFPAACFDAVTSGFLMRNVASIERAFEEMVRVTRPGGRVICLELSPPDQPAFRRFFWWYFGHIVPLIGRLISRHDEAYSYLPQSLAGFVSAEELKAKMESVGLVDVTYRKLMLGTVALHVGMRPR